MRRRSIRTTGGLLVVQDRTQAEPSTRSATRSMAGLTCVTFPFLNMQFFYSLIEGIALQVRSRSDCIIHAAFTLALLDRAMHTSDE